MRQSELLEALLQFQQAKGSEYHIRRIGIFGSAARNQMTDRSDVDIVVELAEPELLAMVGIKQDLEELLSLSVDIIRYRDKMNEFLKQRIEQEAIYV